MVKVKLEWFDPGYKAALVEVTRVPCVGEGIYVMPLDWDEKNGYQPPARVATVTRVTQVSGYNPVTGTWVAYCEVTWERTSTPAAFSEKGG